jgi:hypothetical protein
MHYTHHSNSPNARLTVDRSSICGCQRRLSIKSKISNRTSSHLTEDVAEVANIVEMEEAGLIEAEEATVEVEAVEGAEVAHDAAAYETVDSLTPSQMRLAIPTMTSCRWYETGHGFLPPLTDTAKA